MKNKLEILLEMLRTLSRKMKGSFIQLYHISCYGLMIFMLFYANSLNFMLFYAN